MVQSCSFDLSPARTFVQELFCDFVPSLCFLSALIVQSPTCSTPRAVGSGDVCPGFVSKRLC